MNYNELLRFSDLYRHSKYMGVDRIFRDYYSLQSDCPVPLSLPHGVDFGHCHGPMDIFSVEPIHWSHNHEIHEMAKKIKPSLLIPHPWIMICEGKKIIEGQGVLMIGPPPSPSNDKKLLDLVKDDINHDWSILIKARGNYQDSIKFWQSHGVNAITSGEPDSKFYYRFLDLISSYKAVIGCTFSSALMFAAAIKKDVRLIEGYKYQSYANSMIERQVNFRSPAAKKTVNIFSEGNQELIQRESLRILGGDIKSNSLFDVAAFDTEIRKLKRPFWTSSDSSFSIPYRFREIAAVLLNKPSIIKYGLTDYAAILKKNKVSIMEINEIDAWKGGLNLGNFSLEPVSTHIRTAIPGTAPYGYYN